MNDRLKLLRKTLKYNQKEFGAKLGITDAAISKAEKGVNAVSDRLILSICREFNVNEDWLRNGTGEMFKPAAESSSLIDKLTVEYALDDFQRKLVSEYLNLTPMQKNAVKAFLDKLYTEAEPAETSKFADVPAEQLITEIEERNAELAKRELSASQQQGAM